MFELCLATAEVSHARVGTIVLVNGVGSDHVV
jgi:hypothetical protein